MIEPGAFKAFDYASDLAKQLITLSTGIIALTITFMRDVVKEIGTGKQVLLLSAWLLYFVSMICGVLSLMALTGALAPMGKLATVDVMIPSNARVFGGLQIAAFLLGTLGILFYGWTAIRSDSKAAQNEDQWP